MSHDSKTKNSGLFSSVTTDLQPNRQISPLTHLINNMAGYKFYSNILSDLNKNQQDITKSCLIWNPPVEKCIYYKNITKLRGEMCIARRTHSNSKINCVQTITWCFFFLKCIWRKNKRLLTTWHHLFTQLNPIQYSPVHIAKIKGSLRLWHSIFSMGLFNLLSSEGDFIESWGSRSNLRWIIQIRAAHCQVGTLATLKEEKQNDLPPSITWINQRLQTCCVDLEEGLLGDDARQSCLSQNNKQKEQPKVSLTEICAQNTKKWFL